LALRLRYRIRLRRLPLRGSGLARFMGKDVARAAIRTDCHGCHAAYNEARGIRAKLDNISSLQYSEGLVDVIVTVPTHPQTVPDEIVKTYDPNRVRLIRVEGRRGKTACQNVAMQSATGEIVVFTDATTRIEPHALTALTANFADQSVGCAAGSLVYEVADQNPTGAGVRRTGAMSQAASGGKAPSGRSSA